MSFDYKKYKSLPKISTIVVVVSFLFPFFLIKCNGQTLASVSGVKLCVGTEISPGGGNSSADGETITPKAFAIISLLAAIGGVVVAFSKFEKRLLVSLIVASVGVLCLMVLHLNMNFALGDLGSSKKMITIEMGLGYYLAFLGFLATIIYCAIALKGENNKSIIPPDDLVDDE